jgi:ABC-type transporter Mla subunit MlaD
MAKELREKLKLLEESLKRSSRAKDRAVEILDKFESRYLQMEDDVNKMNRILDVLKLTHDNIEKTIQSIDSIIAKYNTSKAIEKRIENGYV